MKIYIKQEINVKNKLRFLKRKENTYKIQKISYMYLNKLKEWYILSV